MKKIIEGEIPAPKPNRKQRAALATIQKKVEGQGQLSREQLAFLLSEANKALSHQRQTIRNLQAEIEELKRPKTVLIGLDGKAI